jgi:predicted HicB family RNase H-like nuclease
MRRIIDGTAYDTETAELVAERVGYEYAPKLYRTRNGAFFLWCQYVTPSLSVAVEIVPYDAEKARKWLEDNAFGEMLEGRAAERRMTLRIPSHLAERVDERARAQKLTVTRYIIRCLEKEKTDGPDPVF